MLGKVSVLILPKSYETVRKKNYGRNKKPQEQEPQYSTKYYEWCEDSLSALKGLERFLTKILTILSYFSVELKEGQPKKGCRKI